MQAVRGEGEGCGMWRLTYITFTLVTVGIHEGTGAGMGLETLPTMTNPRLTEVTDGTLKHT